LAPDIKTTKNVHHPAGLVEDARAAIVTHLKITETSGELARIPGILPQRFNIQDAARNACPPHIATMGADPVLGDAVGAAGLLDSTLEDVHFSGDPAVSGQLKRVGT